MRKQSSPITPVLNRLRRPLMLTWAGLIAERLVRAFWPFWSVLSASAAALMLGVQDILPINAALCLLLLCTFAMAAFAVRGLRRFHWPDQQEALNRLDGSMPGQPLRALKDRQAIGMDDPGSQALWAAHLRRMAERAAQSRAIKPNLRLSDRDPFGLRYVALLALITALLFGSVRHVSSVTQIAAIAGTPVDQSASWEGWIEPPRYTGLPSLYLNDQKGRIEVPEGSQITLRLYGKANAITVSETVSNRTEDQGINQSAAEQDFEIKTSGTLRIDGPDGQEWDILAIADLPPTVALVEVGATTTFDGQMTQPFRGQDDYGITDGRAMFRLDLNRIDRRYGLVPDPDAREEIVLDLPMPVTGGRIDFTENLIENLSEHPWAHLPVLLQFEVRDEAGQIGLSDQLSLSLPARRFFDPLAAAIIEQRRDLLWSRSNARRVSQLLRAISWKPETGLFRSETAYLRLRVILRRLEALARHDGITKEAQDEMAQALWDLAIILEDGDIGNALDRMRAAQERLSEAMKNGASDDEIAQLMQELRDATEDYLRQKSQQAQRQDDGNGDRQNAENAVRLTQEDLQAMMDRIQELMEEGRFAEAQQALEEFQELMENLRTAEGQGQQGGGEGQQAMEGLADTLREQQGLSDQAFRDLQEQFNPNTQSGQSQGNQGFSGGEGRGESHEGQSGGQGEGGQDGQRDSAQSDGSQSGGGQGNSAGSLAQQQDALRRELERQRNNLPGAGTEAGDQARGALDQAEQAMRDAENALREDNLAEAIDRQADAMEALRDGMRNLDQAMANEAQNPGGQGDALGQFGDQQSDPLGRTPGQGRQAGTQDNLLQGEDTYRRARELLDEIRRRSGEGVRPNVERDYLKRLLDRF